MTPTSDLEAIAVFLCGFSYPKYFYEWEELVKRHKRLLVIASRDHGKTTFFSTLVPLHAAIKKIPEILLVSYSESQVFRIISHIKDLCDNREELRFLKPKNETDDWSKSALKFSNGTHIDTLTFGSSGRGGHYDLIVVDDPIKDFGGMSPDDQEEYYKRALTPMCKPDGQIITVGNYVYDGDLIDRIEKNPAYHVVKYPAIFEGKTLWPERWSLDKLSLRRAEIGDYAFCREYLLEKINSKSAFFRKETFSLYRDEDVMQPMNKLMSVDPALTATGDHSAIILSGTTKENKTYVLDYANLRTDNIQMVLNSIMDMAIAHKVNYLKMEAIGFQRLLRHWLDEEMRKRNYFFGVEEIRTHAKSKEARIMALQPRIQSGSLLFRESHIEIMQQLISFPHGQHDDLIDALSMQVGSWMPPSEEKKEAPEGSFDWWRQQLPNDTNDYKTDLFRDLANAD